MSRHSSGYVPDAELFEFAREIRLGHTDGGRGGGYILTVLPEEGDKIVFLEPLTRLFEGQFDIFGK